MRSFLGGSSPSSRASSMKRRLVMDHTGFRAFRHNTPLASETTYLQKSHIRTSSSTYRCAGYNIVNTRQFSSSSSSSAERTKPPHPSSSHKNKKKRSRRSNLQRTKTPKRLSYKGSSQENRNKSSTKATRKSPNRQSKQGNHHKSKHAKFDSRKTIKSSSGGQNYKSKSKNTSGSDPSIASSIVDRWDNIDNRDRLWENRGAVDSNEEDDESLSSLRKRRGSNATFQLDRFLEKQQEFCESLEDYRLFWYPRRSEKQEGRENPTTNQEDDWKKAMDFHHPNPDENFPWLDLSWEKMVESEHLFRRVCSTHHDLFVSCASYLTDLSETSCHHHHYYNYNLQERKYSDTDEWTTQDLLRAECEDLLREILPSWERLRRERALLVETYQPEDDDEIDQEDPVAKQPPNEEQPIPNALGGDVSTPDTSYQNNQWVGWLKGMITGNNQAIAEGDDASDQPFEKVTAHLSPECAPNHYHYTKLVGRLYFHYLPLERHNRSNPFHLYSKSEREANEESEGKIPYKQALTAWEEKRIDILAKRAEQMQYIVDQSLLPLTPNRNNNGTSVSKPQHHHREDENFDDASDRVLTDKIVRLLIRSYLDMESLSAAQKAERVYHRHPNHRKRLLWYVTMCYLKVITTNKKELARLASVSSSNYRPSEEEQQVQKELFLQYNRECASAAKRICELVSSKHAKEAREFQHCSTIAFEALAILPQYGRRGLKGYYDRVHSLGILKFGPKVWEALLNGGESTISKQPNPEDHSKNSSSRRRKRKTNRKSPHDSQSTDSAMPSTQGTPTQSQSAKQQIDLSESLHSKDHRILNYLIQIYSHEDKDLHRALRLLEVSLDLYSPHDLKESLDRSIFHKLLRKLSEQRRKAYIEQQKKHRKPTNFTNEFDTALVLLDSMVSEQSWFPTEETFRILFSMIPYCKNPGKDAEQLRLKLEACRFLSGLAINQGPEHGHEKFITPDAPYLLNPLEASTLTLRAWLQTLQQHGGNLTTTEASPSQRALAILKAMRVGSSTLFPVDVTDPSESNVLAGDDTREGRTCKNPAPTAALYNLALEVCSRDSGSARDTIDAALEIFEFLQSDNLLLEESSCLALLGVLANFSNTTTSIEDQHDLLQAHAEATRRVCEALADQDPEYGERNPSILEFLVKQISYLQLRHPEVYNEHLAELGLLKT